MECRVIRTSYAATISLNNKTITEWQEYKLPMLVKNIDTDETMGILTWEWFEKHHGESFKKHADKKYRIQVSSFLVVKPKPKRTTILRKAKK